MPLPVVYHTVSPDLSLRTAAQGGDGRTVYGIAVPYNRPTRINDRLTEMFMRGAYGHQVDRPGRVKFARGHLPLGGELIGAAALLREEPAGLYTEFRVSRTPRGDETLALLEDGALDEWSIGFVEVPGQTRMREDGVRVYHRADLREVAVVLEGAYGREAVVAGVRQADLGAAPTDGPDPLAGFSDADRAAIERGRAFLEAGGKVAPLDDIDTKLRMIQAGMGRGN